MNCRESNLQELKNELDYNHSYVENFIKAFKERVTDYGDKQKMKLYFTSLKESTACLMKRETIQLLTEFLQGMEEKLTGDSGEYDEILQLMEGVYINMIEFNKKPESTAPKQITRNENQNEIQPSELPIKKVKVGKPAFSS